MDLIHNTYRAMTDGLGMRAMKMIISLMLVVMGLVLSSVSGEAAQPNEAPAQAALEWSSWNEAAFRRAITEDKLILLDLTAVWCHACHVMDEVTYSDGDIVSLLNTKFIPIRVDSDQRPDIESRYRSGGWPTTSILLPTGEILFQANSLSPEELGEALRESEKLYRLQKEDLSTHAQEIWKKVEKAKKDRKPPSQGLVREAIIEQSGEIMQASFDTVNGGFRDAPKFFEPDAISLAFRLNDQFPDKSLKRMALFTLDKQQALIDPVWGGFYRYATQADWSGPHYEKMLNIQAQNILNYLEAYQVTRDGRYRQVVEDTIDYVNQFLIDQTHGGFYASQDAVVRRSNSSGSFIPGEEYFPLNEKDRSALGIPYVDRSIYTGSNSLMALSYLKTSQVLGNDQLQVFALKTLNHLWMERFQPERGMAHVVAKGKLQGFGWLDNQVRFASALIEAFMTTSDNHYLQRAEELASFLVRHLEDVQAAGFYDRPSSSSDRGLLKFPSKPLEANVHAAMLFCDLFYLTETTSYRNAAERTLRYVLNASGPLPMALIGLTVDRYLRYPVHMVIVGPREDEKTQSLFQQALRVYSPGKIVRILDPEHETLSLGEVNFPRLNEPQAYICTDKLCSAPVANPIDLEATLHELLTNLNEAEKTVE